MNILSPVDVIAIGRIGQPGEKRKLQMVVRIDESGQNEEAGEVDP
jgi:hypothetical protein